jgi:hypothetical protein
VDDQETHPTTNDVNAPVTKFCLALETDRRTVEGRNRSEREFREHFFPYDDSSAKDRILKFLPREMRGPIIAAWGIRGRKAAMRDDDLRVRAVVHDALVAGDIDDKAFEEGVSSDIIIGWGELADWWKFWRGGKQSKYSIQRALETGYDLGLFDARWFFDVLESGGGKLHGTDVLVEGMSKTELADWIKKIHESGDGSPRGLLGSLGWSTLVAKTSNTVLLSVIDAFAQKNGLVKDRFRADADQESGRSGSIESRIDAGPSSQASILPSWSAAPGPPEGDFSPPRREDAALSPPNDALLKELETPSRMEDGDWLENAVSVPAAEGGDDLDVVMLDTSSEAIPDPSDVTSVFQRDDDLGLGELSDVASSVGRSKPALPGLPSSVGNRRSTKTVPPPLPDPKGRKS